MRPEEATINPAVKAPTIRALTSTDRDAALAVIHSGARRYREFNPPVDRDEPAMTLSQWEVLARRITWYGAFVHGQLVGVIGLEYVRDAALLRYGYVFPAYQRQGIATSLGAYVEARIRGACRIIVWTFAGNYKARRGLEKAGYTLSADSEAVLRSYYAIPEDRLKASVAYNKPVFRHPECAHPRENSRVSRSSMALPRPSTPPATRFDDRLAERFAPSELSR